MVNVVRSIEMHIRPTKPPQTCEVPLGRAVSRAAAAVVRRVPFSDQRPDAQPRRRRVHGGVVVRRFGLHGL